MLDCWHCGAATEVKERVEFRQVCGKCDRPVHVCRNCRFYDPSYHNQCRETQAELVADKERANFCEYFAPPDASGARRAGASGRSPVQSTRERLDALFRKK